MGAMAEVRGIITFGMGLTLRSGDREHYYAQLDRHFSDLKQRYIREFGDRYEIPCPNGKALWETFVYECEKNGIERRQDKIFAYLDEFPEPEQLTLEI